MKELLIAAVLATLTIGPLAFAEDREKREDDEIVVIGTRPMPSSVGLGVYTVSPPHESESVPVCAASIAAAGSIAAERCGRLPPGNVKAACMAAVAAAVAGTGSAYCMN